MESELAGVNWLAVISGTVAAFLVGWFWYSARAFGAAWAEGSGVAAGSAQSMPVFAMAAQLLALFLLALVIGITATDDALITAILVILACAAFAVSAGAFVKKSGAAQAIDGGYLVVAGAVMIIFQAIF